MKIRKDIAVSLQEFHIGQKVKIVRSFPSNKHGLYFNPNMLDRVGKVTTIIEIEERESGYTWYRCKEQWLWLPECFEAI